MLLTFPRSIIQELREAKLLEGPMQEVDEWRDVEVEHTIFTKDNLTAIDTFIREREQAIPKEKGTEYRRLISRFNLLNRLTSQKAEDLLTPNLEHLAEALKEYLRPVERHWLFTPAKRDGTQEMVPYFVADIEYHGPVRDDPAHTTISLRALRQGKIVRDSYSWYRKHLGEKGITPSRLLLESNLFLPTPESLATHDANVVRYNQLAPRTGHQFLASGFARTHEEGGESRHSDLRYSKVVSLEVDDVPSKVVMDEIFHREAKGENSFVSDPFWSNKKKNRREVKEDDEIPIVRLPEHPFAAVFDLRKHRFMDVYITQLREYEWDKQLAEKLVIPTDDRRLVKMLIRSSTEKKQDIISGKSSGTMVLASGPAGTGKTLTAEVFSEDSEMPLYIVQCSQLGTDEEELEKKLQSVLERASRWNAILLIDEADVYVRHRGEDIQQNAIVGVFLRLLEYYNGVLFMTTNKGLEVDDAIMSRLTAWVQYDYPDIDARRRIWQIQLENKGLVTHVPEILLEWLARHFEVSGRSILKLAGLARTMVNESGALKDQLLTQEDFTWASRYLDLKKSSSART